MKRLPINASFQAPRWLWTVWGLALLLTIGLALNISPWLLGDADWRWRHVPLIDFTNPYDFVLFLGYGLGLLWLAAVWQTVTDRTSLDERLTSPRRSLVLAFTLTMSLLTLSGVSRAEVGRVWVFLMPLAVLAAFTVEHGPTHSIRHWIMTAALLGVQLLVMQSVLVLDDAIMPSPRERLRLHQTSLPPTAKPMRSHVGQTIAPHVRANTPRPVGNPARL